MIDNEVLIEGNICKSISGQEDENGNYIFEVEASNENLDLQNQRTLQSALMKSKEYFLTNGIISDDHQHKTRNPDGSVESHKDKIIGEPISVRTDGKSTFVKGRLFAGIEAAKPYIELLKNKAKVVKASIGGIMPTIRKEKDGTETVTDFMWNDLALTVSPVNWTVGSARFAKSVSMIDFCKSLEAGSGTNAAEFEGGRALQKEDLEKETVKLLDINEGEMDPADAIEKVGKGRFFDKEELIKASNEMDISDIQDCIMEMNSGNITSADEIIAFLIGRGFDKRKAKETMLEIIEQGGRKMAKGNFSDTVEDILKSIGVKKGADTKEKPEDEEIEKETLFEFDDTDSGDEDDEEDDLEKCGSKGGVKKGCGVKKSLDDDIQADEYLDATELVKSMGEEIDALRAENIELKKSMEETQNSVLEIAKALGEPVARQSVVAKSIGNGSAVPTHNAKPTTADFDTFKNAICKSAQGGGLEPEKVQFYNSEFQKAMKGGIKAVKPEVWSKICSIVRDNH